MRTITHRIPGLVLTDHTFTLPIDYARPADGPLTVFAREVVSPDHERADLPWLIFFQGGPGFGSPRPETTMEWIMRAIKDYRVLLLDQRGAGRSSPITHQTLARLTPDRQAAYLKHFRADNIVRDADAIRRELIGDRAWSALGQSYGGFVITHYLSAAPQGLREAFITGGLPPINHHPDDVYRATYRRVLGKNAKYFKRYPDDVQRVRDIADYLAVNDVRLPNGDRLSVRRFQQLGMLFGASDGFEKVHYLLEEAFVEGAQGREISLVFLRGYDQLMPFEPSPIYAVLQELCYTEGTAANWSAERIRAEYPEFDYTPDQPLLFTGEMVYPWMFDEYAALRPLKEAAQLLAADADWPPLYNRAVLQQNSVPVAAAMYYDDMYVERALSEETASFIKGIKVWATSEYEHNARRADGARVLGRLIDLLHGKA
ncbi:MAG: alpha/beta fold hydrolase [Chloroflexi bacterium]|nr:alpha/beta fold hydrolase [Chloroflexota bacterium]